MVLQRQCITRKKLKELVFQKKKETNNQNSNNSDNNQIERVGALTCASG